MATIPAVPSDTLRLSASMSTYDADAPAEVVEVDAEVVRWRTLGS
eukprot:CAMPEP_0201723098 /NCGR_PEP_ID=MMETSP0593-20130828/7251_1 /ASSEMBLY_ACC=CAM_ASM_000672 /TAXON_ID=267983 /ORGANISM="Skeletonema japonicum, Strain CCMP2506" /LENGTH=44 /DNA_ID= /DNA_START= /DNA_END= /DNA_ORIENTATION=